ncbi:FUSC family protein [Haloferula sp. BvORR071]|uniref:FUSC family protein n=1 Tax=Haloferula sp. BvORR071 TaxID=1396141 RepID=UPI000695DCD4|nr:FUSC family protein [Haloferula sp. BvORR071]
MPASGTTDPIPLSREPESLGPDLRRALRGVVAFMLPLLFSLHSGVRFDPVFACIAAHTISLVDVRGAYSLRFGLLLAMSLILAAATALGIAGAYSLPLALAGTLAMAVAGGLWRHLSSDYGPGLAVSTGLMFLVSLSLHVPQAGAIHPALGTLAGGLFGVLLQVIGWPFHPQHPLRRTVAESWLSLATLLDAMLPEGKDRAERITAKQAEFRATMNQTLALLAPEARRKGSWQQRLELLNLAAARFAVRIIAFNTALEAAMARPTFSPLVPSFAPLLDSLSNTSRTVALAVVSRQPSHLAAFEVRLTRLENLLEVLRSSLEAHPDDAAVTGQLDDMLRQLGEQLQLVHEALLATLDCAGQHGAFSLELADLHSLALRPLAASLNLSRKVDPALIRYTARIAILVSIGVVIFKWLQIPHGYWLPFSMMVVLQPDYGSTRKRAAERMLGTVAGGVIASSLLWLHPPLWVLLSAAALTIAAFSYWVKRAYGIAVIFITLNVVLLLEAHQPVTLAVTAERLGCTLAGGFLALAAAWIFWPVWERQRFPAIMAQALAANAAYLKEVLQRLKQGIVLDESLLMLRRAAESANSEVFSSLRRMNADPRSRRDGLESAAALANGNQRVTNALSVVTLHLNDQHSRHPEILDELQSLGAASFKALQGPATPQSLENILTELEAVSLPQIDPDHRDPSRFREPWVFPQLSRILTEMSAMMLAATQER